MINILQLRYFSVIAYYENISKAALELRVSQPALSKVISSLESELGTPLFDRAGKKLTLNAAGQSFYYTTQSILNQLDDSLANLKNQQERSGVLRIATHISCGELYETIGAFSERYPNVQIKFYRASKLKGDPTRSDYDLVVVPDYEFQDMPHIVLGERRSMDVVLSADHPLAGRESVELTELRDEPFIFISPRDERLDHTYTLCMEAGFTPRVRYVVDDMGPFFNMLLTGKAVALTYNTNGSFFRNRKDICCVPVTGNYRLGRKIGLCLPTDQPTPLALAFWNFAQDRCGRQRERSPGFDDGELE